MPPDDGSSVLKHVGGFFVVVKTIFYSVHKLTDVVTVIFTSVFAAS